MGGNSYRTSHYPYAEEIMDFADQNGIVIIGLLHFLFRNRSVVFIRLAFVEFLDECPAVALDHFDAPLLKNHLQVKEPF